MCLSQTDMKTFLVTGPIGSGKSAVCEYLASRGNPVYDCDSRTKMLYSLVPGLKCSIEQALDISWDNISVIFTDEAKRRKLESIVYPLLLEDINKWKAQSNSPLLFIESAIAASKPIFDGVYDDVILVRAPYSTRLARNPKAEGRDSLQSFENIETDFIIDNDSSLEDLYSKTDKLLCRLI